MTGIVVDELDEKHARVVLDILEGDGGITVYEGVVPDGAKPPYALVYTSVEWPGSGEGAAFDGHTGTCVTRWWIHNAGKGDQGARTVANWTRQLLANVEPEIENRSCGLIEQDEVMPPVSDETTGVLVHDIVHVYQLITFAA